MDQDGPKMAQDVSKMAQDTPKMAQDSPEMAPYAHNTSPRSRQNITKTLHVFWARLCTMSQQEHRQNKHAINGLRRQVVARIPRQLRYHDKVLV